MNIESDKSTINIPLFAFGLIDILISIILLSFISKYCSFNTFMSSFIYFLPCLPVIFLGILSIIQKEKFLKTKKILCLILITVSSILFCIMINLFPGKRNALCNALICSPFIIYFIFHLLQLSKKRRAATLKGFAFIDIYLFILFLSTKDNFTKISEEAFAIFIVALLSSGTLLLKKRRFSYLHTIISSGLGMLGGFALILYGWKINYVIEIIRDWTNIIVILSTIFSILIITYFSLHLISVLRNKQYFVKKEGQ